jgi:hypothetical protein
MDTKRIIKYRITRTLVYLNMLIGSPFNRGFAIMLVLMMLFLLFMLGVAFFFSAWTHAFMARNYLNMRRACVVAEGGVHHAIGAIIGDFVWASHAQNREVNYRWKYGNPGIPVEYALAPSYAMPQTLTILGKEVGLSGVMDPGGGAYGINSDIFHLKVNECSAQLYVNEGLGHPYNTAVMKRILNRLEEQLFDLDYGTGSLGKVIMQNRPSSGYRSKAQLREKLGKDLYDRFKDFLCVHTWSDPKVANPVPLSEDAISAYHPELLKTRPIDKQTGKRICRYGRGKTYLGKPNPEQRMLFYGYETDSASTTELAPASIYGLDELNPCWIEITHRAPVNINTAPREILVALLCDLEGFYLLEQLRCMPSSFDNKVGWCFNRHEWYYTSSDDYATGELGILLRASVPEEMARQIAVEIIQRRKDLPFRTWQDFNNFIDSLVAKGVIQDTRPDEFFHIYKDNYIIDTPLWRQYASQAIADTIKANFNPNLHLNELNPDSNLWQWVDKTDLIKNSTEFCFLPTGYFEIESVGQILRAEWEPGRFHISPYLLIMKDSFEYNNQIMGQRRLKVEVKLWDIYRDTTQSDFYKGSFSPNRAQQYVTQHSQGCISMPEPDNGPAPLENNWEGYISLSPMGGTGLTKEKGKVCSTPIADHTADAMHNLYSNLHAHFEFDFRLHSAKAGCYYEPMTRERIEKDVDYWNSKDPTEEHQVFSSPYCLVYDPARYRLCRGYRWKMGLPEMPKFASSDLRADGFYGERQACLPYYSEGGNFDPYKNTLSYWIKPGFVPELSGKVRIFASAGVRNYFLWDRWYNLHLKEHRGPMPDTDETLPIVFQPFGLPPVGIATPDTKLFGGHWVLGQWPKGVIGLWHPGFAKYYMGTISPTIAGRELRAHRWIHIAWSIKTEAMWWFGQPEYKTINQLWINGERKEFVNAWWKVKMGCKALILGGRPRIQTIDNYPGDITLDEFYL